MRKYINCTKCGSMAVTNDKKNCSSTKKFGKICGGKIIRVEGILVIKTPAILSETGKYTNPTYLGLWRKK